MAVFVVERHVLDSDVKSTIEATFNNTCDLECCSVLMLRVVVYVRHTGTLPIFIQVLHSQAIQIQIKKLKLH